MVFNFFKDTRDIREPKEIKETKDIKEEIYEIKFPKFTDPEFPDFLSLEARADIDTLIIKHNLNKKIIYEYVDKKPIIIHCCHHKTGTVVMDKILRAVSNHFNIKYQYCPQKNLEDDTDIWLDDHSHADFSKINRPIVGTHMIRNPCSVIVSAYEYHKQTNEPWANKKIKNMDGVTYKEVLNSLNPQDGLIFEMKNDLYVESSKNTIMDIYNWDYKKPNFLELRFEDLMNNYDGTLGNIFKHYGFSREMIVKGIELSRKFNLRNKTVDDLKENRHVTNKNLDLDKWKDYFNNDEICKKFWKIYPNDIFDKIGYIDDNLYTLESFFNGKEKKSVLFQDEKISVDIDKILFGSEKMSYGKEKIWKKYNGDNPFLIA